MTTLNIPAPAKSEGPRQAQWKEARSVFPIYLALAKQLGPGHTIVTILCDGGAKYQSRLFNMDWIAERGFLDAIG